MKELTLDELKRTELDILKYIDKVCEENNITYFLDSGTLLGAVRHKGFIPWDDDIDIIVLRKDYDHLFDLLKNGERYKMVWYKNEKNYVQPYGKVCDTETVVVERAKTSTETQYGVFVDVFPIDNYPDGALARKIYLAKCKFYRLLRAKAYFSEPGSSFVGKIAAIAVKGKDPAYFLKRLNDVASKYKNKKTECARHVVATTSLAKLGYSSWFEDGGKMQFEDAEFSVPKGYKEYLEMMYGDYMQLPPEDKRHPQHTFTAYKKD